MPQILPDLRRGRIIWASVRDHHGIPKQRPVIILTATDEIKSDEKFEALAITTSFQQPTPDDCIELPWHPQGRVLTQLRKRSAAVLTWIAEVHPDDILQFHGDVPMRLMIRILERLKTL